jgi:hypothetical protein
MMPSHEKPQSFFGGQKKKPKEKQQCMRDA